MRRAHFDFGFMLQDNKLVGVSLGYDRCAEHEWGIRGIESSLGVKIPAVPIGIEDRMVSQFPGHLKFVKYTAKPRDKRRKGYPAAYLMLDRNWQDESLERDPVGALGRMEAYFIGEMTDKGHNPIWDIASAWDRDNFVINVRGAENIEKLEAMYEAFKSCNISMALPWAKAFFRGGLSFVIASEVSEEERSNIRDRDLAHKKLTDAATATGIYEVLAAAGLKYYALSPSWLDSEVQTDVIFFLNPEKQQDYNFGWFTVEELQAWTKSQGPIVKHPQIVAFDKANRDFGYNLLSGLKAQDIYLRVGEALTWADEAKTIVGARLLVAAQSQDKLASGIYPVDELMARFPAPETEKA